MLVISNADKIRLKACMPEYLQIVHGITDLRKPFLVPWRKDSKPSCYYQAKTHTVIDAARGTAKDVFQLAGYDFNLDSFPDQVHKVADIVNEQIEEDASTPIRTPKAKRQRFDVPDKAGFDETPLLSFAWMMERCLESDAAKKYLHGRGFCNHDIYQNVLGYAPSKDVLLNDDGSKMFSIYEPNRPCGYVVVPFPADESFCTVNYVMLRAIPGDLPPTHKEIRPRGFKAPLYREYLLSSACDVLFIAEGLLDTMALEILLKDRPCMGLGGTPMAGRVGRVLYFTPKEYRPRKIILALDADEAGREATAKIRGDLDYIGIPHSVLDMPPGAKDPADALLQFGGGR